VALGNLDLYAMDTVKAGQRWTLVAGLRATWNTNPVNQHGLFARPAGSFLDMEHSLSQPLNKAIQANVRDLFPSTPLFSWQPRASAAYKLSDKWALHAGGGVFNDIIPVQVADLGATNAPYAPIFVGGINGIFQGSGPQYANRVPGVPLYRKTPVSGVTQTGNRQWLNPDAFASVVDPSTGACAGGDSPVNCQFGNSDRNGVRGPHFTYSEVYLTKKVPITEHVTFRFDTQLFNVFNHSNFALPSNQAGTPVNPATQTGFGALTSTISPPTGLLGVGLGGDSSPRMIAFQGKIEF
jgi:hypothetical protein